jgi:uncharacterized hydrophobic protein (TIGR00271 family)
MSAVVASPAPPAQRTLFRPSKDIYEGVAEGRQFDALYFSMLVFGCLIALLGLLLNSPAVIIGAMLISPLMGPILSCGLALTLADGVLARKAGRNLGLSIVETIVIAALATWMSPLKDATPEILARTNPNLIDLLIAFFSGIAGTLALCSRRAGFTIVPGVAIATAVMPPLATVGYGISTLQWNIASGAFMLLLTNLAAIIVSADLVFLAVGVRLVRPPMQEHEPWWIRHRMAISWVVLATISVPLVKTLVRAADQSRVRAQVRSVLEQQLNHPGERRLDEVSVRIDRDRVLADAVVQTADMISPEEEKRLEADLSHRLGREVVLQFDQLQMAHATTPAPSTLGPDYVAGGKIRPEQEAAKLSIPTMLQQVRDSANGVLGPLLQPIGVEKFTISSVTEGKAGGLIIDVTGSYADDAADISAWKVISAAAAQKFNVPVRLTAIVYLPQSQIVWIPYRGAGIHPTSSELRKAQHVLADWDKQGWKHGYVAPNTDAKPVPQRVEYLQSKLGEGLTLPDELNEAAGTEANRVGLAPVQVIDVSSATKPPED